MTVSVKPPSSSDSDPSAFVTAQLTYFVPPSDGSKPYTYINATQLNPLYDRNWTSVVHPVQIENIRGKEDNLEEVSLDVCGFQFFKEGTECEKWGDEDGDIEKVYYEECIEKVKRITGATLVVPFDHTIRRRRPGQLDDGPTKRQPVSFVHVDQTPTSARNRVHMHAPTSPSSRSPSELLQRRFQIINLWRPISQPAYDWPLTLCDFRSIEYDNDLVPSTLKYPDRDGETFNVKWNEGHRWVYVKGMTPDEFVLIKCYDSQEDGKVALLTPHTAFEDPTTPPDAPLRESIEVRLLVFYD